MPNVATPRTDGSSDPSTAHPEPERPRSALPLGFGPWPSSDGNLPPDRVDGVATFGGACATIGASSTTDGAPRALHERDNELIDFLVRKAIEKCMPSRPDPSISMRSAGQRASRRKA
jgi:hypothetical protein